MEFDPNAYLDQTTSQASERRPPVPAGDYIATIQNLEAATWQSKTKLDPATGQLMGGLKFNITLGIDLPDSIQEMCKIKTLVLTDGVMVDRNDSGAIDYSPGRNGRLRQYREVTDLNKPGESFSPRMLVGKLIKVRITHEEWNGNILEKVGALARI